MLSVPEHKIIVTSDVQNTEQEATEVAGILKSHRDIILVTSAFHMARAKSTFESKGFRVSAYPVDFKVSENAINLMSLLPSPGGVWQTDLAIRELAGVAFYRLKRLITGTPPRDIIEQ